MSTDSHVKAIAAFAKVVGATVYSFNNTIIRPPGDTYRSGSVLIDLAKVAQKDFGETYAKKLFDAGFVKGEVATKYEIRGAFSAFVTSFGGIESETVDGLTDLENRIVDLEGKQ